MIKDGIYWATQIKQGNVSTQELLSETVARVTALNGRYNAVVALDVEEASKRVQHQNYQVAGPFGGVPFPLKMLGQAKKGWPATEGSRLLQGQTATRTAHFVTKVEAAGFVTMGQTNAPEFGFKNVSDATLYGVTKNVWHPNYHAGGSSGGAVSALASGMYPVVGASDGGGSIRIPASFSGVIGLKPTRGSMPVGPQGWRSWQGAAIDFGLTVSMRDTKGLFAALKGTPKAAPYQSPSYDQAQRKQKRPLKIACCLSSPIGNEVSEEAQSAYLKAVNFLAQQGHELTEIPYPVAGLSLIKSYYGMNGAETVALMAGIERTLGRQVRKTDVEPMTWAIYQYGHHIAAGEYVQYLSEWDEAAYIMETLFEDYDLFLSPTATTTAPKISTDLQSEPIRKGLDQAAELNKAELATLVYKMFEKSLKITPYTQLANLTGQPAISLPIYVGPSGLPIGIQLMASKGREDLLFHVGEEFENKQQFILPRYYRE